MESRVIPLSTLEMFKKICFEDNSPVHVHLRNIREWNRTIKANNQRMYNIIHEVPAETLADVFSNIYSQLSNAIMSKDKFEEYKDLSNQNAELSILIEKETAFIKAVQINYNAITKAELQQEKAQITSNISSWNGMYYKMIGSTATVALSGLALFLKTYLDETAPLVKGVELLILFGVIVEGTIHNFKGKKAALLKGEIEEAKLDYVNIALQPHKKPY